MGNKVLRHCCILVQETEISQWEEPFFLSKLTLG